MKPEITVLMTIHNDFSLFSIALNSLKLQSFDSWELLILDNSDNNPKSWDIIMEEVQKDSRIRAWKSPGHNGNQSVGWPKGASILLEQAEGEYVTFLSADDFIDEAAFEHIHKCIHLEHPDVIWVGYAYVDLIGDEFQLLGCSVPEYRVFESNKLDEVGYVLSNTYYNSMFHYTRTDFLREYNINFFEPYYADYVSMTAALVFAKKTVALDKLVYYLTRNTSQTSGAYTYRFYEKFGRQWALLRELLIRENCQDAELYNYVLQRIYRNFEGNLKALQARAKCRDDYMNPIPVTEQLIREQIDEMRRNEDIKDMVDLLGITL